MEITEHFIDVRKVFASKNATLLKIIPGFVIRYLKRIVHEDEVNGYIFKHRDKSGLPFVEAILREFGVRIQASGIQHLESGRYIIVANHPLGGLDGMALMQEVGKVRLDLVFPVNDLLMNVPGLQPLFIPINKHGKNTQNVKIIDETFASGKVILYFPAGLVSRKMKRGIIRDLEWKKTFISKARKYQRDIIPVYITGRNSDFFYNLALWRKRIGITANVEMLFLVDEMMKQRDKTISLTFGEPISWTTFDRTRTDNQWAQWVKERVYLMADDG